jgi:zinc/manganese transport system substrate-binding protein
VHDSIAPIRAIGLGIALSLFVSFGGVRAAPLNIVAAENVYGDIARQIGGDRVAVVSILNNPAQDPHLFEADASTARAVADAQLLIYNGIGYDPWMVKLLSATRGQDRAVLVVADLVHAVPGGNPHLWYDLDAISALAEAIADRLPAADKADKMKTLDRLIAFDASMLRLTVRVTALKDKYAGVPVTATEPVFDYMARAIGLDMRNPAFQRAVMNDTEPSARDVAAFEDDLRQHRVKVLLYNVQATGTVPDRMRRIAEEAHIPVVGVSEVEPPGMRYQDWISSELDALEEALSETRK